MIARKEWPEEFRLLNQKYHAPYGPNWWQRRRVKRLLWAKRMELPAWMMRLIGPFGFQGNSPSRAFEYPWCFFCTPLSPGMRAVDIGAGASGFQFVLAERGLEVTSIDPLIDTEGSHWVFSPSAHEKLQKAFGVTLQFVPKYLHEAELQSDSYDRVFSISVMEHASAEMIARTSKEIGRILKPGGLFVATVDLFLGCYPFTDKISNKWGSNVSIRDLVDASGMELVQGNRSELYGYPEFDVETIRRLSSNSTDFMIVNKESLLTQCLVLEKPKNGVAAHAASGH